MVNRVCTAKRTAQAIAGAKRIEVLRLWPTMSVRDIAMELDVTTNFVIGAATRAGLGSREISWVPGTPRRKHYDWKTPKE